MKSKKVHPKIEKNLFDIKHERYLRKTHTLVNVIGGFIVSFVILLAGGIVTEQIPFDDKTIYWSLLIITSFLIFAFVPYKSWKRKRLETVEQIKNLNASKL